MNRLSFASFVCLSLLLIGCHHRTSPVSKYGSWNPDPTLVDELKRQDTATNGIEVGAPKFYDDASLKAMLDQTRARLAAVNGLNEAALVSHLGAITGSTVDQTQFGIQIMGPQPGSVATTDTGPTTQTTTNSGLPAGQTTLPTSTTVATNPSQSTVTTTNPPASILPTIPSGLTYTPPSTMSGSALDVLNEEMQLNDDIAGYQLLLEGALSDRFVQNENIIKPRTTIGFPISLSPQARYQNAVAVVEVEVANAGETLSNEPPIITTILPREKTYNVAALTDSTKSIGAGVVIHAISIGGSWATGHKTFYVVQDQDTVALQRPVEQPQDLDPNSKEPKKTRFAWEFRPVLGEKFVRGGLKQTFVQLTLPVLPGKPCFGSITVHTYWRRFDQKTGMATDPIEASALFSRTFSIPNYNLTPAVEDVTYQDLGDGNLRVRVQGQFLAGTYVQLGPARYDSAKGLLVEERALSFVAPAAALARWPGYVVSRGGERARLVTSQAQDYVPKPNQLSCVAPEAGGHPARVPVAQMTHVQPSQDGHSATIDMQTVPDEPITPAQLTIVDEQTNDKLRLTSIRSVSLQGDHAAITAQLTGAADVCRFGSIRIAAVDTRPWGETDTEMTVRFASSSIPLDDVLLDVGHKVFGLSDSPVKRNSTSHTIVAIVPTSLMVAGRGVRAFHLFWTSPEKYGQDADQARNECFTSSKDLTDFDIDAPSEKLVLLSMNPNGDATYLLYGNELSNITILSPASVALAPLDNTSTDRMRLLTIPKDALKSTKKLVVEKELGRRPLVLDIPQPEPKAPKISLDSPVILNTDRMKVPIDRVPDLVSVKMLDKKLQYTKGKDFIELTNLRADAVTNEQSTKELVFEFNDGTKVSLKLEVVAQRIGVK